MKIHAYKEHDKGKDDATGVGFTYCHLYGLCGVKFSLIVAIWENPHVSVAKGYFPMLTENPAEVTCLRCQRARRYGLWVLDRTKL